MYGIKQLLKGLELSEGSFSLFFAKCDSLDEFNNLVNEVGLSHDVSSLVIPPDLDSDLPLWIAEHQTSKETPLFVFGLSELLFVANHESQAIPRHVQKHLGTMNGNRGGFKINSDSNSNTPDRPIVFCINNETLANLQILTPDFYGIHSGVFYPNEL